jgi:glycosyltransferase involved in cell wall biosynthesis
VRQQLLFPPDPDRGVLLFVADSAAQFLSHRLPVALAAQNAGFHVHVAAPQDYAAQQGMESYAITCHPCTLPESGRHLPAVLAALWRLRTLFRQLQPAVVHLVASGPVLYGGLVARMIPALVATITRADDILGDGFWARAVCRYVFAHPRLRAIFQNEDDRTLFLEGELLKPWQTKLVRGTGVNMQQFHPTPEPEEGDPIVLLASRLRWDKGVREFVFAARALRQWGVPVRFVLAGELDPGQPLAIESAQVREWQAEGLVEWWGQQTDMASTLSQAHIVCLPAWRTGLPKVLVEAAACARPIVATDVPGCREIVINGKNGYLVPPGDSRALSETLRHLLDHPGLRKDMARSTRQIAIREFSIGHIVDETLQVYDEISG